MRAGILLALLVAAPALADHNHRPGRLVVVEKDDMQRKLADANALLSDLMSRMRGRDRQSAALMRAIRDNLDEMRDALDEAPQVAPGAPVIYPDGRPGHIGGPPPPVSQPAPPPKTVPTPPPPPGTVPTRPPQPQQPTTPVVYPIADHSLRSLIAAIRHESFPRDKLRVLQQAAPSNWFVVVQVQELLALFDYPGDRLKAMRSLKPRILDTENYYQLYASFEYPADKAELRRILEQP